MAASPGAGSGTPSSSKKMTKNRPPDWWSITNTRMKCVSGRHQPGSRSQAGIQSGILSARTMASVSIDCAARLSVCRGRQDLPSGAPHQRGVENATEMLGVRAGGACRLHLVSSDRLDGGGALFCMPARDDAVEIPEVRRQVEGEAVADDRAVQLDADGGQLLAMGPD